MSKITLEEWQGQVDDYDIKIKELKTKKASLIKALEDTKGLDCIRGKLVKREMIYGAFWDMTYYSHFDGHKSSAVYEDHKGACEISKDDLDGLIRLIKQYILLSDVVPTLGSPSVEKDKEALEEKAVELLDDIGPECMYYQEEVLRGFKIIDEDTLEWEYGGNDEQGDLCSDSRMTIKKTTKKEVKSTKFVDGKTHYD